MVFEHAPVGTPVGDPIGVYQGDSDPLTFEHSGPGHSLFSVEAAPNGGAQISVAGDLDYETRTEYRLTLSVSDGKDRTSNVNPSVDDMIIARIHVTDVDETFSARLIASDTSPRIGDTITFRVEVDHPPVPGDQLRWRWEERNTTAPRQGISESGSGLPGLRRVTQQGNSVSRTYHITLWPENDLGNQVVSNTITVNWR